MNARTIATNLLLVSAAPLLISSSLVYAEVKIPPKPGNLLSASVSVEVSQDPATHLYKYSYTVTNLDSSVQDGWLFWVEVAPETSVVNITAPQGWSAALHGSLPMVTWAATQVNEIPADYDGVSTIPSPYNIKPGQIVAGFSFESVSSPADAKFYVQGFTDIPVVDDIDDLYEAGYQPKPVTENSYNGITTSAIVTDIYLGNRRPSVDGFLGFLNLKNDDVFGVPSTIIIKLAVNGETVDATTFNAVLNGVDVTHLFQVDSMYGGDRYAVFSPDNSPIKAGKNVLVTSVEGVVPDSNRRAADVDRMTFTVR